MAALQGQRYPCRCTLIYSKIVWTQPIVIVAKLPITLAMYIGTASIHNKFKNKIVAHMYLYYHMASFDKNKHHVIQIFGMGKFLANSSYQKGECHLSHSAFD